MALNPMTADLSVQILSLTLIQCAITPRNPTFIDSAVHMSTVTEILPGAA